MSSMTNALSPREAKKAVRARVTSFDAAFHVRESVNPILAEIFVARVQQAVLRKLGPASLPVESVVTALRTEASEMATEPWLAQLIREATDLWAET
ncbi:MAG: hypothetical protein ABIP74_03415, partial [Candidatus Saccharimonas sp.]